MRKCQVKTDPFNKDVETYNFSAILEITVAGLEGNSRPRGGKLIILWHPVIQISFLRDLKCLRNMQIGRKISMLVTMLAGGYLT